MFGSKSVTTAYNMLTSEDDGRACRDIEEAACQHKEKNFFTHIASLSLTKSGDALIDPKLVQSWLLTALSVPPVFIGLLVPIREAGALLPQLFTAGYLRRRPKRKFLWALGAFLQGLCVAMIAIAAMTLTGSLAGGNA